MLKNLLKTGGPGPGPGPGLGPAAAHEEQRGSKFKKGFYWKYLLSDITNHALYKGAEVVFSIWLTLAHANDMHVLSSKDLEIGYTYSLSTPVIYISARLSASIFRRQWVHWLVDFIFMVIFSCNYILVFLYLLSELPGNQELHNKFFKPQRTPLRRGMVFGRALIAMVLCVLLVIDNVVQLTMRKRLRQIKY